MESNVTPVVCPRGASRYTWREGDTLRNLAILNGVSEQAIRLANQGRDLSALEPGDELCIPPQQLSCVSGDLYTVQRGDTFSSIAERFGITTLELSERNPFVDPSNLRSGEVLCVPETAATPTPPEDLPTPVPSLYAVEAVHSLHAVHSLYTLHTHAFYTLYSGAQMSQRLHRGHGAIWPELCRPVAPV